MTTPYTGRFSFDISVKLIVESNCPNSMEHEIETRGEDWLVRGFVRLNDTEYAIESSVVILVVSVRAPCT